MRLQVVKNNKNGEKREKVFRTFLKPDFKKSIYNSLVYRLEMCIYGMGKEPIALSMKLAKKFLFDVGVRIGKLKKDNVSVRHFVILDSSSNSLKTATI